ncbi:MAG: hypothetical protein AAFY41_14500, partial [Bacteroidota bacterium]
MLQNFLDTTTIFVDNPVLLNYLDTANLQVSDTTLLSLLRDSLGKDWELLPVKSCASYNSTLIGAMQILPDNLVKIKTDFTSDGETIDVAFVDLGAGQRHIFITNTDSVVIDYSKFPTGTYRPVIWFSLAKSGFTFSLSLSQLSMEDGSIVQQPGNELDFTRNVFTQSETVAQEFCIYNSDGERLGCYNQFGVDVPIQTCFVLDPEDVVLSGPPLEGQDIINALDSIYVDFQYLTDYLDTATLMVKNEQLQNQLDTITIDVRDTDLFNLLDTATLSIDNSELIDFLDTTTLIVDNPDLINFLDTTNLSVCDTCALYLLPDKECWAEIDTVEVCYYESINFLISCNPFVSGSCGASDTLIGIYSDGILLPLSYPYLVANNTEQWE